jgi:hypothetical protein
MTSKHFNYVVHSNGRLVSGSLSSKVAINPDRMTQLASWSVQKAALNEGWEFDLMNFSVAIQPIGK